MGSVRSWNVWVLAWVLLVACSQSGDVAFEEGDASVDASTSEEGSTLAPSEEARAVVARLDARLEAMAKAKPPSSPGEPAVLEEPPPPAAVRLSRAGEFVLVRAEANPRARHAELRLPTDARGAFRIADKQSGLEAAVALRGASEAEAEIVDGKIVYRKAASFGTADLVHRPSAEGTEDFILFDENPGEESLVYEISLSANVAGLRLVENTLELVDEGGAPRLRVAPPYVIGADGQRHDATLSVEGCAFDTNPAAPWGRMPRDPGASQCIVQISWAGRNASYPLVVDPSWTTAGDMSIPRAQHGAVLLKTGKVLVAGGASTNGTIVPSAELYDPITNTWSQTSAMPVARRDFTATQLASGRVLVAGGHNSSLYLSSAHLYEPATGTWAPTAGGMAFARARHFAAPLGDGSVLIGGGSSGTAAINAAERFDPNTNTFAAVGSMASARQRAQAVALNNGKVLVAGGQGVNSTYLNSAELYDPALEVFTFTPTFSGARANHTMTLLGSGEVIVFGGYNGSAWLGTAVLYNPTANTWSASVDQGYSQEQHTATLLRDGRVLMAGGYRHGGYVPTALLYDPATNSTSEASWMRRASRALHTATMLPAGNVLVAGGYAGSWLSSAEVFTIAETCSQAADCPSGFCVHGYCCNSPCDDACARCDITGSEGVCQAKEYRDGDTTCSPYRCTGSAMTCPVSCTSNRQCDDAHYCSGNRCIPKLENGAACLNGSSCLSDFCNDGYCCDAACAGACDVCAAAYGASANGTCTNLPSSTACNTRYLCTGTSGACPTSCTSDDDCFETAYCGAGRCVARLDNGQSCTSARQCASEHCVDGRCCNRACEGACERCHTVSLGICGNVAAGNPGEPSCFPFACNGMSSACPTACSADSHCGAGLYCKDGACIDRLAAGEACSAKTQCQSGHCVDGFCCDKACAGPCETCAASLGAMTNGVCGPRPLGTPFCGDYVCNGKSGECPRWCESDAECPEGRYCTTVGGCAMKRPQGNGCARADECESGHCVDGVCCNGPCANGCDRCDLAASRGLCTVVVKGGVGRDPSCGGFSCDGASASCPTSCSTDAQCLSSAICVSGTCVDKRSRGASCSEDRQCQSGYCANGLCCNSRCNGGSCQRCDLSGTPGTCTIVPLGSEASSSCFPYVCSGSSATCPTSCTGDSNCAVGLGCIGGVCQQRAPNGSECAVGSECESGHCADGFCCNTSCQVGCARCDLTGFEGVCKAVPADTKGRGCGLYLCNGTDTGCPTSCTGDDACDDGHCKASECQPKGDNGSACETAAECKSGHCTDGVCCESACGGQCARCDEPGSLGLCKAATGAPVGKRASCESDGSVCGGSCNGVDAEACSYPNDSTECGDPSCEDGVRTYALLCDGKGGCGFETEVCAPYACDGSECRYACESDADCTQSAGCVDGECRGVLEVGDSCMAGGECKSGFCADGVCCESACTTDCMVCNLEGSKGSCVRDVSDAACSQMDEAEEAWLPESSDSACGCRVAGERREGNAPLVFAGLGIGTALLRRRRGSRPPPPSH